MSLVVVYEAHGTVVSDVMAALRRGGLHPVSLDDPDPNVLHTSKGTYLFRIAVPAAEARTARSVLAEIERASQPGVQALDRRFKRILLASFGVAGAAACLFRLLCESWGDVPWLVVVLVAFASLILGGNADRLRTVLNRRRRRKER